MSNREASKVYELIVESVINEVREDFENAGIDEQTLQDLRRNWQMRLSETKVSNFSWDEVANQTLNTQPTENVSGVVDEFGIKQEPNTGQPDLDQGLVLPGFDPNNLPRPPSNLTTDDNNAPVIKEENIDGINENQSTLPEESTEEKTDQSEENTTTTTTTTDNTNTTTTTNGQIELTLEDPNGTVEEQLRLQEKKAKRSALLDTDEVGSELDDSDDDYLISEGEDDGPDENLMLCLYDKVTRTKARWKCSLKDGIVTINHKDFTFQKAQVEAEWV